MSRARSRAARCAPVLVSAAALAGVAWWAALIGLVVLVTRYGGLGRLRTLRPLSSRA